MSSMTGRERRIVVKPASIYGAVVLAIALGATVRASDAQGTPSLTSSLQNTAPTPADGAGLNPVSAPPYQLLRQDEDYRYLRNASLRTDWWDPIKYIPLDAKGSRYLTLGGEVRERFEYFSHPLWGQAPQDDG